jgi:hypothetical protein
MMERSEDYQLLLLAKHEILELRRRNEVLSAKVETMELFDRAISAQVSIRPLRYSEDFVWRIEKRLNELDNPSPTAAP